MRRRRFVKSTLVGGILVSPLGKLFANDVVKLPKTPSDYEGPFYPQGPKHYNTDLILSEPRDKVMRLRGIVVDAEKNPLQSASVEIWQTDSLGRYNHPRDSRSGKRWDDFLYWAETKVDKNGKFEFRTYIPGAYGGRPAHVHYKVWMNSKVLLTSQFYFAELGGAAGASRYPRYHDLQTFKLTAVDSINHTCDVMVVV